MKRLLVFNLERPRGSAVFAGGVGLHQLGEFLAEVVCFHPSDQKTRVTIEEAPLQKVGVHEASGRRQQPEQCAGALAALEHLPRAELGIAFDALAELIE